MSAVKMNTKIAGDFVKSIDSKGYYSVEFAVGQPHPIYQFKIWHSESRSMFVVVKENSAVLPKLKAGSVVNMTYYSTDSQCPKKEIETKIGPITSEERGRFEGHCTINLQPVQ